jgi:hypothetical protein
MLIDVRNVDWWDKDQICRNVRFYGPESLAREISKGFAGFMDMKALAGNPEWESCRPNQSPSDIAATLSGVVSSVFASYGPIENIGAEHLLQRCESNAACKFVQETYRAVVDHEQSLKVCQPISA